MHHLDKTYCEIVECAKDLSMQINSIYNVCPKIFLNFNSVNEVGGSTGIYYRIHDMYIELDIPHNYTFGRVHRNEFIFMFIHEYCHYIDALTMSGKDRVNSITNYLNNSQYKCLDERRNWTTVKRVAKKLKLWNKPLYNAIRNYSYTAAIRF